LRDGPVVAVPAKAEEWLRSQDSAVALVPPFVKRTIEIDADRQLFSQRGIATAVLEFATVLGGQKRLQNKATLRSTDAAASKVVSIYHDRNEPVAYRVSWHATSGSTVGALDVLESDYLLLVPPEARRPGDHP
jgi:hypothetical protein